MEPVGIDLKCIREEKKISLSQIALATRINLTYLRSLEEGRYGDMPGGMYNRAFLKAYCEYLKIDPAQYLERYDNETSLPREKALKSRTKPPVQSGFEIKPHPLMVWGAMLLVSVSGLYYSRHWIASTFSPYFSRSPVTQITQLQPTTQVAPPAETAAPPAPAVPSPTDSNPTPHAQAKNTLVALEPPPAGTMRIEFHVLDKCWVSVNSDGARVLVKLLEPGEEQYFDATDRFYIILGNAGGVRLKINGKPAKMLGKSGEVVRVLINQQNLPELLERSTG